MMRSIYLDNSTTSFPSVKTKEKMMPFFNNYWGSPLSPHVKGQELIPFMKEFYQILYNAVGASELDDFILTSSGTEAVNQVIFSTYYHTTLLTGRNQFLSCSTDEASSILSISELEKLGCSYQTIPVDESGKITLDSLAESISPRTCLISVCWANGLTGVIQPVEEIAEFCRERGIRLHVDATHVIGKINFDLKDIPIDYLTFNGPQIHGPIGTGGLFVKKGSPCSPLIFGAADQGGLRAGQLNLPGLAGLATAIAEAVENRDLLCSEISRLRNRLENGICTDTTAIVCYKNQFRLPHCTALLFPHVNNEALLFLLNQQGVLATIGGGNFQQLSLLLKASTFEDSLANSALSFSLSRYTTEEEIDLTTHITRESFKKLLIYSSQISPSPLCT